MYEQVTGKTITERKTFDDSTDINVQKAAGIGIVNGVGDNKYSPNTELTREQAATMLSRLASVIGKPIAQNAATFNDNSSISSWALEAVGQMQASGIMDGVGNNTFDPQGAYTREQSIVTIMRLYDVVKPITKVTGIAILSRHRDISDAERKISIEPYRIEVLDTSTPASASFDIVIYPVEIAKNYDYTLTLSNENMGHIEKMEPFRKEAIDSINFIADANGTTVITVSCEGFSDSFTVSATGAAPTPTAPPTGKYEFYKECPSVPDFASVMGEDSFTLTKVENMEAFDMVVYTYRWNKTRPFVMGEYYDLLENIGFKHSANPIAGWTNDEFIVMGSVIREQVTITVHEDNYSNYDDSSLGGWESIIRAAMRLHSRLF